MSRPAQAEFTLFATRPLLKWAGGKTQMLGEIMPRMPKVYGRYIEPFFGGGALFFAVRPKGGIIADSNPELVNLYTSVAHSVNEVVRHLRSFPVTETAFYELRSRDWTTLPPAEAAARTIYLNRTCFNGLYRVNRSGGFNVPYGHYKNPKVIDEDALFAAAVLLKETKIVCGDYKTVLRENAKSGDFVFLDPPYLPISKYSDFRRYTKEQFLEEDHHELAAEVRRLHESGCHVILTNSNHPLVHELYAPFERQVIQTKRYISCQGEGRKGEDVIVNAPPRQQFSIRLVPEPLPSQVGLYPPTRFMGSKTKLLREIWSVASQFKFDTAIDLFSGSGVVGYMFKCHGKRVISNDYLAMSVTTAQALIENNHVRLSRRRAESLMRRNHKPDWFVSTTFKDLYYKDDENELIDIIRANIAGLRSKYERAIAMTALMRACIKKRPRGIFTYVGHRYDDGRKDLRVSFQQHFLDAVESINAAVLDNHHTNKTHHGDAMHFRLKERGLVYMDPPYFSPFSDNEYVRRYHFLEGLARGWEGVEIQEHTATKKFKSYPTPFTSRKGATDAFDLLFKKFKQNIIVVSYSSNSLPTMDEMVAIMAKYKARVEVVPVDYKYSFGNQGNKVGDNKNDVKEYLFVGFD